MLLSSVAIVTWNPKNKSRYVNLGYKFTKMGESVEVSITDLTVGSRAEVSVSCDYCGKVFTQQWSTYARLKREGILNTDCCGDPECTGKKARLSLLERYKVPNAAYIDGVKETREKTNLDRYGVRNVFESDDMKAKIKDSCMTKYGVSHPMKLVSTQKKVSDTCSSRYGVPCYLNLDYGVGMRTRDKNARWNSDKTDEQRESERRLPEYRTWRNEVFKRDGFHCVKCGSKGVVFGKRCKSNGLNAHHIFSYKTNPEVRYDVDNGITLCNKCHQQFHSEYGKTGNNQEQLLEFLDQDKKIC